MVGVPGVVVNWVGVQRSVGVLRMVISWLDECGRSVGVPGMATCRAMCGDNWAVRMRAIDWCANSANHVAGQV